MDGVCWPECRNEATSPQYPCLLSTQVSERAEVGKALRVHVSLTNTLSVALSHCTMVLEGSGLINGQISNE